MSVGDLIDDLRPRHVAIAAVLVRDGDTSVSIDPGADPLGLRTLFEIGSITKTMTGTLLAQLVLDGTLRLETTVGDILGHRGGAARSVTLRSLATHTSGLPRLAPRLAGPEPPADDPYREFDRDALVEALAIVELAPPEAGAAPVYSNLGFQLLGHLLEVATGRPYADLVVELLTTVGCTDARCGDVRDGDERMPGYDGRKVVPHWTQPLPGAGGVELGIDDLGRWIGTNTFPSASPLGEALRLAQDVHWGDRLDGRGLGWRHYNGGILQNGGTGGFRSFSAFVPDLAGVGILTNLAEWDAIDGVAIRYLTRVLAGND